MAEMVIDLGKAFGRKPRTVAGKLVQKCLAREDFIIEALTFGIEGKEFPIRRIVECVRNLIDILELETRLPQTKAQSLDGEISSCACGRLKRSSAAAATTRPSTTNAAAESWPCDMRYSRSSKAGHSARLKLIDFGIPLKPT